MNTYKITINSYDDNKTHVFVCHEEANNAYEAVMNVCPQCIDTSKKVNDELIEDIYTCIDYDELGRMEKMTAIRVA